MTIQRRVFIWLLVLAPAMWVLSLIGSYFYAQEEVNELFNTQQVRLAQQTLISADKLVPAGPEKVLANPISPTDDFDTEDLIVSVWTLSGKALMPPDPVGTITFKAAENQFEQQQISGKDWIVYYLTNHDAKRVVAVAQLAEERTEVLIQLLSAYMVPWIISLPLTLAGIAFALNRAFRPMRQLSRDIQARRPEDLQAISADDAPDDLKPLIGSMNQLFGRINDTLSHERRLTADASHELRSPIAALQVQWDAWHMANDEETRLAAKARIGESIARLKRLVGQIMSLSAVESDSATHAKAPIQWHVVIENSLSDLLPLMESRQSDIEVDWPEPQSSALPLHGNAALLTMMLRNVLDNALRYGPARQLINLRFSADELIIEDQGPGIPASVATRLGERFVRPPGQTGPGSGIGVSIVLNIARLHSLAVKFETATPAATERAADGRSTGTRVVISRVTPGR